MSSARALLLASGLFAASAGLVQAVPFNYFESFSKFGQQQNFTCPAPGPGSNGVCAGIAAINSFAFLQNMFGAPYTGNLLPNYDPLTKTDMKDAMAFAVSGWGEPAFPHTDDTPNADSDMGYYSRCSPASCPGGPNQSYLDTKMDWISDHVPGNSTFFAMYLTPTIAQLANEIKNQEDVEFFVKDVVNATEEMAENETDEAAEGTPPNTTPEPPEEGEEFYHALTLTAIMCDANTPPNCSIKYQDPNRPTVEQPFAALTLNGGRLEFNFNDPNLFAGAVFIDAAFSESAVPEPSTLILFTAGLAGLAAFRRWRRAL